MHVPTLLYAMSAVTLFAAAVMAREGIERKGTGPELFWWSAGFLCLTIGGLLTTIRAPHIDFMAYGGGNACVIAGYVLIWRGVREFCGQTLSLAWLLFAPLWIALYAFTPILSDVENRIVGVSSFEVFVSVACALDLIALKKPIRAAVDLAILYLAHAVFYVMRIATVRNDGAIIDVRALIGQTFTIVIFEGVIFVLGASYLLLAMSRQRIFRQMQATSETDYLTGIDNRRAFSEKADTALAEIARSRGTTSLLLFDLDHFKWINDRHGHMSGDAVLKLFCRVVEANLAPGDLFGRLGGEEFAALLPATDLASAERKGRAILLAFAAKARELDGRTINATVSAGLATTAETAADMPALLKAADKALYRAKTLGRNRVETVNAENPALAPAAE